MGPQYGGQIHLRRIDSPPFILGQNKLISSSGASACHWSGVADRPKINRAIRDVAVLRSPHRRSALKHDGVGR
jgi:hypothetical protein